MTLDGFPCTDSGSRLAATRDDSNVVYRPHAIWWDQVRFDRSHAPPGLRWVRLRRPRRDTPAVVIPFPRRSPILEPEDPDDQPSASTVAASRLHSRESVPLVASWLGPGAGPFGKLLAHVWPIVQRGGIEIRTVRPHQGAGLGVP